MVHYTLLSYHEKSLKEYKDYKLEFQVFYFKKQIAFCIYFLVQTVRSLYLQQTTVMVFF